jgi:hypothetical protein
MYKHAFLIAVTISLILTHASAQVQEIESDRPDQANTPVLVPKGAFQIETGVMVEKDNTQEQESVNYVFNNSLLKFGLNKYVEARLAFGYLGVKQISDQASVSSGFGPVAVGVKIKLLDQHGVWPQAAVITNVTLKTGAKEFRPPFTSTDVALALYSSITSKLSVTFNGGVKWSGPRPEASWLYATAIGYNLTDKLTTFVETYGFFPELYPSEHYTDFGFTYKVTPRLVLDTSAGVGLNENAKKVFISSGVSIRLFK